MARTLRIKNINFYKFSAWAIITFTLVALTVYSSCNSSKNNDEIVYLNHEANVGYVGIEKCSECHGDKHATFIHTGMGLSFDSATKEKSAAYFGSDHLVYDSVSGFSYLPYWRDDQLYIKEFELFNDDTIHSLDRKIDYIVGSGQHTNSHLISENGYLYQAPITFYVQKGKWDLAPGFENGNNTRFSRILSTECISCHNAMPKMVDESDFKYSKIGNGIDCERCHGPGELHVKQREAGKGVNVTENIDPTIVNPRKLSWQRQIDLCQRCHLQGLNLLKEGKKFTDFKPGMVLSDIFDIYLPDFEGDNSPFDMANHSDRFQRSECFIQSNDKDLTFTCISCHNPHVSVKSTSVEVYNNVCQNCHTNKECTEELTQLKASDYDCVSCHMPQSGSEDIPHVTVHDHYIRVPQNKEDATRVKRLVGLYAVNNASPSILNQTKAYLEYWEKFDKNPFYLQQAKSLLPKVSDSRIHLKYFYLTEQFEKAAQLELDDTELTAWELFMQARSYLKTNRNSLGLYTLETAYKKDPTQPTIAEELIKRLIDAGKLEEAKSYLEDILSEFPSNGKLYASLAKALILEGRLEEARTPLEKATSLEPKDLSLWFTWLNYAVKKQEKDVFIYWAGRIRKEAPERLSEKDVTAILETM